MTEALTHPFVRDRLVFGCWVVSALGALWAVGSAPVRRWRGRGR